MGFFSKKRQVTVQFIDVDGDVEFKPISMDPESLPESFRITTSMHLAGAEWRVIEAKPDLREQYAATGKLRVTMRRADRPQFVSLDPKETCFTLPTVDANLPSTRPGAAKGGKNVLHLHEDDWRQAELVPFALADAINATLADVTAIYDEHQLEGGGFRQCARRERIADPLAGAGITVEVAASIFAAGEEVLTGIAIPSIGAWVEFPFAVRSTGGITLYGDRSGAQLRCLAVHRESPRRPPESEIQRLAEFAAIKKLYLIDWVEAWPYKPNVDEFAKFFAGGAKQA